MKGKHIYYDSNVFERIAEHTDSVAKMVEPTLGSYGKWAIIQDGIRFPQVTNDGASILRDFSAPQRDADILGSFIKEASVRTQEVAGDGSTTTAIITNALLQTGIKNLTSGIDASLYIAGIEEAEKDYYYFLNTLRKPIKSREQVEHIAKTSAKEVKIGSLISEALDMAGKHGVVSIEEGQKTEDSVTYVEGFVIEKEPASIYFRNGEDLELNDPFILVTNDRIDSLKPFQSLLDTLANDYKGKPVILVARDFSDEVLSLLLVNRKNRILNSVAIKAPGFGDKRENALQDLALLVGANYIDKRKFENLSNVSVDYLGSATKVTVGRNKTVIFKGSGSKEDRLNKVQKLREQLSSTESEYESEQIQERIAKLLQGVVRIHITAMTESAMKERKSRVEDALSATKASIEEGVVVGGGSSLLHIANQMQDLIKDKDSSLSFNRGYTSFIKAIQEPFKILLLNAEENPHYYIKSFQDRLEEQAGEDLPVFDFRKREMVYNHTVYDPAKVLRVSVQNSVSVAKTLLRTKVMILKR